MCEPTSSSSFPASRAPATATTSPGKLGDQLLEVLSARDGLVCLVGAGGKKTTLYRLALSHPGRIGITSTVYIPPFPESLGACQVIAEQQRLRAAVMQAAATARVVAFAQPSEKRGRLGGVAPWVVADLHIAAQFDVTLIKADGARSRWVKAPDDTEPQLPEAGTTVIPVVSARAIGEPLSERIAHRVERIARITGARLGEPLTPEHIARLLTDPQGALKGIGSAQVIPLINMVDDRQREVLAREAAELALSLSRRFDRVVLASMTRPNALIAVVYR